LHKTRAAMLKDGYLCEPRTQVENSAFRPFFALPALKSTKTLETG
jgi:hypothetical protein